MPIPTPRPPVDLAMGGRSSADARRAIGAAASGANSDLSSLLGPGGAGIDFLAGATSVAVAATIDIGALTTIKATITGAGAITGFGTAPHRVRLLRFTGAATLTHNATSLILPGAADILTAAGDTALATSDASGNWTVRHYQAASGKAVVGPAAADITDAGATGRAVLAAADAGAAAVALGLGLPFRNRLRNAGFTINQRAVSGTVTLAAGAYGHDGFKAGANGCTYTFARSGGVTTLTLSAGTLVQVIEGALYMTEGGTYTASWLGTALARLNGGAYAASPIVASGLTADANLTVEWGTGTLALPQVEPGNRRTVFEQRDDEARRCRRYYRTSYDGVPPGAANATTPIIRFVDPTSSYPTVANVLFETPMRTSPTVALYSTKSGVAGKSYAVNMDVDLPVFVSALNANGFAVGVSNYATQYDVRTAYTASAEL